MKKHFDKGIIQKSVDDIIETKQYNEAYGKQVLALVDTVAKRRGLYFSWGRDDVDFIFKPNMVDDLLTKIYHYDRSKSSAYTYMITIINSSIKDSIRKIIIERKNKTNYEESEREKRTEVRYTYR